MWHKNETDPEQVKVEDICAEDFLYSPVGESGTRCFQTEQKLQELETTIARMYPVVAEEFPDLDQAWGIKKLMSLFLSTLLLRHPNELEGNRHTHRQLVAYYETFPRDAQGRPIVPPFEQEGQRYPFDSSQWDEYRAAGENEIRKMFSGSIHANAVPLANAIFEKRWVFLCLDEPRLFTSDLPVVVKHPERQNAGLLTQGVNMFFPLTPKRMLHITDRQDNLDGFYPFPADRAAELNFFTFANARLLLCHEQPDTLLGALNQFADDMIAAAYERCCRAVDAAGLRGRGGRRPE